MTHRHLTTWIFAACLTLLLAGPLPASEHRCGDNKCNAGETAASCPADCGGGEGGGGFLPTCDTFRDDPDDRVSSDGQGLLAGNDFTGEYCDRERHISAVIGETRGGHHLDTEKSGRELDLDFSQCASALCTQLDGFSGSTEAVLSIETRDDFHLLEMDPGTDDYVGLVIGFDNGRKNHVRLSFGRDTTVVACPNSGSPVHVIRVDDVTWTFESSPTDMACLSEVQSNDWNNPVAHGFFHMPFLLRVKLQP